MKKLFLHLAGGLFVLGFGFAGVVMARDLLRTWESRSWPKAAGVVTHSEVRTESGSRGKSGYRGHVSYTYTVAERRYTGSRISFADTSTSDSIPAQNCVRRYPRGTTVDVYHSPDDPELAVLEPGELSVFMFLFPALGFVVCVVGPALALRDWLKKRRSPARID